MPSIDVTNSPQKLSMQDMRSILNQHGGLAKTCRFVAILRPSGSLISQYSIFSKDLMYLCESAELPGRGMLNLDLRYYGPSFKLPIQSQYEDINMTFLCRNESFERQFFDDWMLMMNPINTFDFNYRDDYASSIDIYQLSEMGKTSGGVMEIGTVLEPEDARYSFTLHNAYPLLVNPQPVAWMDDNFQRLVVSFTYTHWTRPGLDSTPRINELVKGRIR